MNGLDNIHYGFGDHYKWQSLQIVHYIGYVGTALGTGVLDIGPSGAGLEPPYF